MIGQNRLQCMLNSLTTLPQTILLCGDYGSGRHTFINEVSKKFGFPTIDITDNIDVEFLTTITLSVLPTIYIIDVDKLSDKQCNALLKTIEEPSNCCYFMLLTINEKQVISTIINRCLIWSMDSYSDEELFNFNNDEFCRKVFNTPGKLLTIKNYDIQQIKDLAINIFLHIKDANWANILTIVDKFSYKTEDQTKLPIDFFADVLMYYLFDILCNNTIPTNNYTHCITALKSFKTYLSIPNIDKQKLFEKLLFELKIILLTR